MIEFRESDSSDGRCGFQLIQEYFQQQVCRHCSQRYAPEGIELVRQEPGILVVRVACASCRRPLGIALVGMSSGAKRLQPSSARKSGPTPPDWSKTDLERLSGKPPISYDDVLDAHSFFENLGSDWANYLPSTKTRRKH